MRQCVVAGCGARLPVRRLRGEQRGHLLPVIDVLRFQRLLPTREAGTVAHQVADFDPALSVGGELRPIARDRRVEVELPTVGDQQRGQRRHRLGRGIDVDDGVALPGARARFVGEATPDVDHRLAVQRDAEGCADVLAAREVGLELLAHGREFVFHTSVGTAHGSCSQCRSAEPRCELRVTPVRRALAGTAPRDRSANATLPCRRRPQLL